MSEGNVSATPPAANGSEMDAGNVPVGISAGPSAGTKRKRLPENTDGQSDDIGDTEDGDEDVYLKHMRVLGSIIQRRFRLQSKNVGTIRRSLEDMRSAFTELQKKLEFNRNFMLGAIQTSYERCQERLDGETAKMDKLFEDGETAKMDKLFEELLKCKAAHEQAVKDTLSELKEGRDLLLKQHDESRKTDENIASSFIGKIDKLLNELKERDKDDQRTANLAMMCGGFLKKLSV